ncbi:MAG: class I SAM-dependent methyltransferase [Planctomycetes bacterium]|nr:class I SAM-dependent methyltransferase [Planctomycetota bacterium]
MTSVQTTSRAETFYDRQYAGDRYASPTTASRHGGHRMLGQFIERFSLQNKRCLEIGCGRGAFQDLVDDYTGVDISTSVRQCLHKPFYHASATSLPFEDNSFDAAWSIWVLEHIVDPEKALLEMRRVLKPGGLLLLCPAWQCRSWAAEGYPVRPYRDFSLKGKLIKSTVPLRDSVPYRSLSIAPRRAIRLCQWVFTRRPVTLRARKLKPNYERFWMSDSDAVNSIDPYEAILWFVSRGDRCLTYPEHRSQFLVRTGEIVFRINKPESIG